VVSKISCFLTVVILFLFFVGTSLNFELVGAQNSYADLINDGWSLINHGMPNEAILVYDEILRKDPKHVDALIGKGVALKNLQKFEEAKNSLDAALKLEPDSLSVNVERLFVLQYLKDHDEIRRSLVEILGPNLDRIPYFYNVNCHTCFGHVPFLFPMRDTDDYIGSVQIKMRDSNDNLVGVIESDLIYYPNHPIFDSSLSEYPVSRTLEKDGKVYEMRKIVTKEMKPVAQLLFLNSISLFVNINFTNVEEGTIEKGKVPVTFLFGVNMGIAIEDGDHFVTEWEIGKKI